MTTKTVRDLRLVLAAVLAFGASGVHALDCDQAAKNATELYTAKASKNNAAYSKLKQDMLSQSTNIYAMLVRVVDEGLYASPETMHKAALKYCTRKQASN